TISRRLLILTDLDKSLFSTYDKVYSLKRSRKDKDKDEDPSAGSDRWMKKRKTSNDVKPIKAPKTKESKSGSSKGTKSQSKSSGKSVHAEEPEFEVAYFDMPQDQEENLGNDDEKPKRKTPQQGPTQSWLMTLSTHIDFFAYIMNGLKITNLTQETLLGPAFKLLKDTWTNCTKLEYDFEECYKALSEKLDWENPEGGDYPFDLTKPLPLVINGNHQIVSVDYFFNNDLKYLQGGISTMTYMTSITKTKATQYDIPGIKDMVPNIWSPVKVAYDKHEIWGISHWRDQRKTFYGYARGLESSHDVYYTKRIMAVTRVKKHGYSKESQRSLNGSQKLSEEDQRHQARNYPTRLMHSDELYKFSDGTLIGLRTSLDDITKNIRMEYLPQRRWSSLEKKRAHIMIKATEKQLKERRMMRSFEKFVGGIHYGTDLRLLQRAI
ncbi:hypothetical protein Tco_1495648, partial [Tanacetum coccineum]